MIQKKVRKEVEAFAESMIISKEVVQKGREENILSKEKTMKKETKKETKPEESKPKPRKTRSTTPSSSPAKPTNKPKSLATPSSEGKRKRGQARVFICIAEEENESNEVVKEIKDKVSKASKASKEKSGKKHKLSELDKALKKGKLEVIPPMYLDEMLMRL
ncbi:uncharacterized protein LOC131859062 [Cryptomeria japonica]|uniref:uncharacterized protein LOC131859062 n=1 Tax=Cryptomeria japonica TaxID=3369 RepID=UPI0027DA3C82|nr:uncharacterized protein LOC131859062 [Cryptomeria japonica]